MYSLKTRFQLSLISLLLVAISGAALGDNFPGTKPSRTMIKTQEKAQSLFEMEKYDRALLIYKKDLAPLGDKHAQYMVGYIYLAGKGVARDPITASAWYRLSAERENPQFRRVSDKLLALMNEEQRAQSDKLFAELRREIGDVVLLARLIREDLDILESRLGSTVIRQNEFERGNFKTPSGRFESAAERITTRIDTMIPLIDSDQTLVGDERTELLEFVRDARTKVENFYAMN